VGLGRTARAHGGRHSCDSTNIGAACVLVKPSLARACTLVCTLVCMREASRRVAWSSAGGVDQLMSA